MKPTLIVDNDADDAQNLTPERRQSKQAARLRGHRFGNWIREQLDNPPTETKNAKE